MHLYMYVFVCYVYVCIMYILVCVCSLRIIQIDVCAVCVKRFNYHM